MGTRFKINCDENPNDIITIISNNLNQFGLTITQVEVENGVMEYEIVKLK